jgi:hypothetical protein
MTKKLDEIDLHSKEVQDILGRIPSWLIRNGILMVIFLLTVFIAGSWFFKYPDIIAVPVVVYASENENPKSITTVIQLKRDLSASLKIGQNVNLKFSSYPYLKYGMVKGIVSGVSSLPVHDYYPVEITLSFPLVSTSGQEFKFQQELKGTAEISTEDRRLLDRILQPTKK